jgi:hypothetical protein
MILRTDAAFQVIIGKHGLNWILTYQLDNLREEWTTGKK